MIDDSQADLTSWMACIAWTPRNKNKGGQFHIVIGITFFVRKIFWELVTFVRVQTGPRRSGLIRPNSYSRATLSTRDSSRELSRLAQIRLKGPTFQLDASATWGAKLLGMDVGTINAPVYIFITYPVSSESSHRKTQQERYSSYLKNRTHGNASESTKWVPSCYAIITQSPLSG